MVISNNHGHGRQFINGYFHHLAGNNPTHDSRGYAEALLRMKEMDILVEYTLAIEIKAVEKNMPIHLAQLHTYLILDRINVGLMINFNVSCLKNGIKRPVI